MSFVSGFSGHRISGRGRWPQFNFFEGLRLGMDVTGTGHHEKYRAILNRATFERRSCLSLRLTPTHPIAEVDLHAPDVRG